MSEYIESTSVYGNLMLDDISGSNILVIDWPNDLSGSAKHCNNGKTGVRASKNVNQPASVNCNFPFKNRIKIS